MAYYKYVTQTRRTSCVAAREIKMKSAVQMLVVCATLVGAQNALAIGYAITPLDDLASPRFISNPSSSVSSINNAGAVTGSAQINDWISGYSERATVWSNGIATNVSPVNAWSSWAGGINTAGEIVGQFTASNTYPGYLSKGFYSYNGQVTDLGYGQAVSINDAGQVLINRGSDPGIHTVEIWQSGIGSLMTVGDLFGGGRGSYAYEINDQGAFVGYSYLGYDSYHAFLHHNGIATDLGTFGGRFSNAIGMNNLNQVVGAADLADQFGQHAFLWGNGVMRDLTPNAMQSVAEDINNHGQIVGWGDGGAFLWFEDQYLNLNQLLGTAGMGIYLSEAVAINDSGWIVASGSLNGQGRGFLLTPLVSSVPTPPTSILMLTGLGLLGLIKRFRKGACAPLLLL